MANLEPGVGPDLRALARRCTREGIEQQLAALARRAREAVEGQVVLEVAGRTVRFDGVSEAARFAFGLLQAWHAEQIARAAG